jgi:16S rRNA (adenine1518-N6/adenine1519-N6)-dimethyltransferase
MNLEPLHVRELLKQYDLHPRKSLGQNFLADHNALLKVIESAEVEPRDRVLEIGAGLGGLTRLLAVQAQSVTAVEIDAKLFPALEAVTAPFGNVNLVEGDILNFPMETFFDTDGYKVVANIPYYITSAVIRHLLEASVRPGRIVLTMQREVAERIVSRDEKMSLLSLSVLVYGTARIDSQIPSACFYPRPKVDSSVLVIDLHDRLQVLPEDVRWVFKLAHAAFNQKRKMLRNSLQSVLGGDSDSISGVLESAGIDPQQRPETLLLEDWLRLAEVVKENKMGKGE